MNSLPAIRQPPTAVRPSVTHRATRWVWIRPDSTDGTTRNRTAEHVRPFARQNESDEQRSARSPPNTSSVVSRLSSLVATEPSVRDRSSSCAEEDRNSTRLDSIDQSVVAAPYTKTDSNTMFKSGKLRFVVMLRGDFPDSLVHVRSFVFRPVRRRSRYSFRRVF